MRDEREEKKDIDVYIYQEASRNTLDFTVTYNPTQAKTHKAQIFGRQLLRPHPTHHYAS
jgi:hypothetical protein